MINNTIIEANKQGRKATVFALAHPALYMIEMAAHVGFDAISIDGEHGGFPEEAIAAAGYDAAWVGQKSWNGVAILSRVGEPVVTRRSLPGDATDVQARYIEALITGADTRPVRVASIYLPNGNPQPGPIHRGGRRRHPRRLDLCAERQSAARGKVCLQAHLA